MKSIFCVIAMTLVANLICGLTITYPNGGETLVKGNTYDIKWYGGISGNVAITLLSGSRKIVVSSGTPNDGSYSWKVPVDLPRAQSKIKINHLSDSSSWDQSDGNISFNSPTISITSPKTGDVLREGAEHTITWTSSCYEGEVFIFCEGLTSSMISWAAPNSGSFKWKVPEPAGEKQDNCRIGMYFQNYDSYNEYIYGEYFTVVADYYSSSNKTSTSSSTSSQSQSSPTSSVRSSTSGKQIPGFVFVQGGSFTMGDTRGLGMQKNELPTHTITLNSFYIGKYEVTQAEYSQYMQPADSWSSSYGLGDNYPAYYVSWYAILKYCNLRSMAEGLTPCYTINGSTNPANWGSVPTSSDASWDAAICNWNANGYRLPTEAEWEYAARGATNNPDYLNSGSDDLNAVAWYYDNSGHLSHPVGTKAPNQLGIYDMSGNLFERCWDWYSKDYYSSSPRNNPTGPNSGTDRVVRSGCWETLGVHHCRAASRYSGNPYSSISKFTGFRLCRAVP